MRLPLFLPCAISLVLAGFGRAGEPASVRDLYGSQNLDILKNPDRVEVALLGSQAFSERKERTPRITVTPDVQETLSKILASGKTYLYSWEDRLPGETTPAARAVFHRGKEKVTLKFSSSFSTLAFSSPFQSGMAYPAINAGILKDIFQQLFTGQDLRPGFAFMGLEEGNISVLPERYQPATFDLKTGRLKVGPRELTFSPFLMSLFPRDQLGLIEITASHLDDPELGHLRISGFPVEELTLEEAVAALRHKLAGTPAEKVTFRFIDKPETEPNYLPETDPLKQPRKDWRQIKLNREDFPNQQPLEILANLAREVNARIEIRNDHEIWIFPESGTFEALETRDYFIPRAVFNEPPTDFESFLKSNGMRFYRGSAVKYDPHRRTVILTNTPSEQELFSSLFE